MVIQSTLVGIRPATSSDGQPIVTKQGERIMNFDFDGNFFFFAQGVPPIQSPGEYGMVVKSFWSKTDKGKSIMKHVCMEWWSVRNPALSSASLAASRLASQVSAVGA